MDVINPHRFSTAAPAVDFDGFGNASRYFDGVSDYIDLGDSDDFSFGDGAGNDSPFSISAWVKLGTISNDCVIIGKYAQPNGEWLLWYNGNNNEFRFSVYVQSGMGWIRARSSVTINAGQWYHVVGTYDGSKSKFGMKIYVDGSLDTTNDTGGGYSYMTNTTTPVYIGKWSSTFFFDGKVADVRIYDTDLSSTDITALYGGENITTNLIGHWLKDTPSLLDHSGTNDGTNEGSAFAYDNPSPAVEFGKASRVFNGTSDYIEASNTVSIGTGSMSWSAWAKTPSLFTGSSVDTIARVGDNGGAAGGNSAYDGLHLLFYQNKLTVYFAEFTNYGGAFIYQTSSTYNVNQWYHLCCVLNASTQKLELYVDGVLDGSVDVSAAYPWNLTATKPPTIGVRLIGTTYRHHFAGSIADVRLYDDVLSSTDALALYNGTNVETNLIGHWLTNTDDVKDYAGVNDGTNNGSTYSFDNPLSEGEFGSASRDFNGTSDYITVPDGSWLPTGAQTWACWVKADTITGNHFLMSHYAGVGLQRSIVMYIQSNGSVKVNISPDGNTPNLAAVQTAANSITTGKWYHVAFEYLPSTHIKIFINGSQAAIETTNIPSSAHDSTDVFTMGASSAGSSFLNGNLADCRIYDTNLTATDIFNLSRGYDYRTNLIGQWLTNKDDVDDYAGTNHGTNNGSTYSQDAPL